MFGGNVKGGKVKGKYPEDLSSEGEQILGRGRVIPTTPWDACFKAIALSIGVKNSDLAQVCPNCHNFPPSTMFSGDELFNDVEPLVPTISPTNSPTTSPNTSKTPTKPPTNSPTTFSSSTPTVFPDNCVDGDGEFFYEMNHKNTEPITNSCSWLSKNKNKSKICSKNVDYYNDFVPPQDLCQHTCASCGACFENPNSKYVHVMRKSGKVKLKTCDWLAALSTKNKENFCKKKKYMSGGYDKPKITCPVTCLVGDCKA